MRSSGYWKGNEKQKENELISMCKRNPDITNKELSEVFGKTVKSISEKRAELGILAKGSLADKPQIDKNQWTPNETKELTKLKFAGSLTVMEIAKRLRRTLGSVRTKVQSLNKEIRNGERPYNKDSEEGYSYGQPERKVKGLEEIKKINDWNEEKLDSIRRKCNFKSDFKYKMSPFYPYMMIQMPDRIKEKVKIIPMGDYHYGCPSCCTGKIDQWIDWIKSRDNVFVIVMGDLVENSNKYSVADSIYHQTISSGQQKIDMIEKLAPIRHKIICILEGNHSKRTVKEVNLSPEKDIAEFLEVPFFSNQCYIDVLYKDRLFEIFATHGSSGSTSDAGRVNSVMKSRKFTSADIHLMGHTHDKFVKEVVEVIRDRSKMALNMRKVYYVNTGSFYSYWNSYAEQKLYPPSPIGCVNVELFENGDYHCSA